MAYDPKARDALVQRTINERVADAKPIPRDLVRVLDGSEDATQQFMMWTRNKANPGDVFILPSGSRLRSDSRLWWTPKHETKGITIMAEPGKDVFPVLDFSQREEEYLDDDQVKWQIGTEDNAMLNNDNLGPNEEGSHALDYEGASGVSFGSAKTFRYWGGTISKCYGSAFSVASHEHPARSPWSENISLMPTALIDIGRHVITPNAGRHVVLQHAYIENARRYCIVEAGHAGGADWLWLVNNKLGPGNTVVVLHNSGPVNNFIFWGHEEDGGQIQVAVRPPLHQRWKNYWIGENIQTFDGGLNPFEVHRVDGLHAHRNRVPIRKRGGKAGRVGFKMSQTCDVDITDDNNFDSMDGTPPYALSQIVRPCPE